MKVFEAMMSMYKVGFGIGVMIAIAMVILLDIGKAACLKKAGEKYWKGFVPFYNTYLMYKIVGLKGFFVIVEILQVAITTISLVMSFGLFNDVFTTLEDVEYDTTNLHSKYSYYDDSDLDEYEEKIEELSTEYMSKSVVLGLISNVLSILALILAIFYAIKISKAFGKGGGYIAGMILVPLIFTMIIGLGSSKYVGNNEGEVNNN